MANIEILYSTDRDDMDAIADNYDDDLVPLAAVKLGKIKWNETRMIFTPEAALPEHEERMHEFFDAHPDTLPSWKHFVDTMRHRIKSDTSLLGENSCGNAFFHDDKCGEVEHGFYCTCNGWTLRDMFESDAIVYRSPTNDCNIDAKRTTTKASGKTPIAVDDFEDKTACDQPSFC